MSKRWGDAVLKIAEENPDIMLDGVHTETPNSKVKGNKYKAQTTVIDGLQFASKAEAKRYQKLRLLESVGAIRGLTVQPSYVLQRAFTDVQGRKHRAITYVADFRYERDGETIVEDVKGGKATQTPAFRMKWKMAIAKYQDVRFELVEM